MFRHMLVPLDGSRLAESVLPPVAFLARALSSRVTLLHVLEKSPPGTVHGDRHLGESGEATAYLAGLAAREILEGVAVSCHVHETREGDPARSMASHAEELSADLVALCVHGRAGVKDWIRGSHAQRVVALGRLPVLLVPARGRGEPPPFAARRLLTPLDADPAHEPGALLAANLARHLKASLHLVLVVQKARDLHGERGAAARLLPGAARALLDALEDRGEDYLDGWIEKLSKEGARVTAEVARGDPARAILAAARRGEADLIVLGTHGQSALGGFWAGSVTPSIVWRARRPLLLVPVDQAGSRE